MIGNQGREFAMSKKTEQQVDTFWEMVDEVLNAVLFLLIGLELLIITFELPALWAGLKGGISVALALSLPIGPERDLILPMAYVVVVFSILVQGLTVKKVLGAGT